MAFPVEKVKLVATVVVGMEKKQVQLAPTQQTFLRTYSWEETPIAFTVEKVKLVATVELGMEEKQVQLAPTQYTFLTTYSWEGRGERKNWTRRWGSCW